MLITSETFVCDIAVNLPTAIPVLERYRIGYCCDGQQSLADACAKRNLDLAPVLEELLRQQQDETKPTDAQWLQMSLKELTEYIVRKHHAYTRDQLKLIDSLMSKVEQRHGGSHPEVFETGKGFAALSSELTHHFSYEETTLFPCISALEAGRQPELPAAANGGIKSPVSRGMQGHDQVADKVRTLRKLTNDYTPPPDACPTWRALYRAMEEVESDLHQHIHLEDDILFPRALDRVNTEIHTAVTH